MLTTCHSSLSKPPPELGPGAKDVGRAADLHRVFWDIHGHVITVDVLRNQHVGSHFDASRSSFSPRSRTGGHWIGGTRFGGVVASVVP